MSVSSYALSGAASEWHSRFAQASSMIRASSKRIAEQQEHITGSRRPPRRGRRSMGLQIHKRIAKNFTIARVCADSRLIITETITIKK